MSYERRGPLPPGHPATWGAITPPGTPYPLPPMTRAGDGRRKARLPTEAHGADDGDGDGLAFMATTDLSTARSGLAIPVRAQAVAAPPTKEHQQ